MASSKHFLLAGLIVFSSLCAVDEALARRQPISFDAAKYEAEATDFSFVVAGASAREPFMVAGHLILRVKQGRNDYSFDWGVFDPTKKDFFLNYMRGKLDYEHIVRPFSETIDIYSYQRRQLSEYAINLTTVQKERLLRGLVEWAKPENRTYAYDIVYRNCSTAIGDLLVDAVGPELATRLAREAKQTVRQSGLSFLAHFPPIAVFTDLVGGPQGDRPISERDLFYLPVLFAEVLKEVPAYDDEGRVIPGVGLLSEPKIILPGDDLQPVSTRWTMHTAGAVALSFLLLTCLAAVRPRLAWLFLAPATIYLLLCAVVGGILTFLVFFTLHRFAWSNLHIFYYWPFDVFAAIYAARISILHLLGRSLRRDWTFLATYAALHLAVGAAIWLGVVVLAPVKQDIFAGYALTMPFFGMLLVVCLRTRATVANGQA